MSWRDFSSKGGKATLQRYGKEHYADMGKKGKAKRWEGHVKKVRGKSSD